MSVNSISGYDSTVAAATTTNTKPATEEQTSTTESGASASTFSDTAAVYEKSSDADSQNTDAKVTEKKDCSALVAQLKADAEARQQQLLSIVQKTISQQGKTFGLASGDSIWSFLAKGDFTVTPDVKAQAQADIADDGYWGVEQTSDRILDFAKALAGDDPDKADELLEAFKKGYSQATKAWGQKLPDISQRTYEAVEKKFAEWKNSANKTDTTASSTEDVTA